MQITHYGHAACLVEHEGARVLIDPGTQSSGWTSLGELDAVLVTHAHADHLDVDGVATLLDGQPRIAFYGDADSVAKLARGTAVMGGERLDVAGLAIDVIPTPHAKVYADVPGIAHVAYAIAGLSVLHPGDSFVVPDGEVDVLLLPVSGPWIKISDAIDYMRAVRPRIVIPIHEAANVQNATTFGMLDRFAPDGTTFMPLERATPVSVDEIESPR